MNAKSVKIGAALCMIIGVVAVMAQSNAVALLLPLGLVGFIIGRFLE